MQIKNKQLTGLLPVSTNTAMSSTKDMVFQTAGFTVTLPLTVFSGDYFRIVRDGDLSSGVTLAAPLGFTINGGATYKVNNEADTWLLVLVGTNWLVKASTSSATIASAMGFDGVTSTISVNGHSGYDPSYTFNDSSLTFNITPNTRQDVWVKGKLFTKTAAETIDIPGDGLYSIVYRTDGALHAVAGNFDFATEAPVACSYRYNGKLLYLADERHGIIMDSTTHEYLHKTRGAAYASGFGISNYTLTGTGDLSSDATIALTGGTFYDEDFKIVIQDGASGYFTQPLSTVAKIPVLSRVDATGWTVSPATNYPLETNTRMRYNVNTAGVWSKTDVQNNRYGIMYIVATNNLLAPVMAIMGQSDYTEKGAAEAELFSSMDMSGLPIAEFRPLYKLVYQSSDTFSNAPKAALRSVMDLRQTHSSMGTVAIPVNDHGNLSGLQDDDHPQYFNQLRGDARYARVVYVNSLNPANATVFDTVYPAVSNTVGLAALPNTIYQTTDLNLWVYSVAQSAYTELTIPTTTGITPVVYSGGAFINARASSAALCADMLTLTDGNRIKTGRVNWPNHGLAVGNYYFLSQTVAGGITNVAPTSGLIQKLFFVENASVIHVDVEPAAQPGEQSPQFSWSGGAITRIDYASGNYKLLTYTASGLPERIDYHSGTTVHRKDFSYSLSGDLISVTDSTLS